MDIEERKRELIFRERMQQVLRGTAQLFDFAGVITSREKREIRQRMRQKTNQSDRPRSAKIGQDLKNVL